MSPWGVTAPGFVVPKLVVPINGFTQSTGVFAILYDTNVKAITPHNKTLLILNSS